MTTLGRAAARYSSYLRMGRNWEEPEATCKGSEQGIVECTVGPELPRTLRVRRMRNILDGPCWRLQGVLLEH